MTTITAQRPAYLDVDVETVIRRGCLLGEWVAEHAGESDSHEPSARACSMEALCCLVRHWENVPFPAKTDSVMLPNDWLQAAAAWVFRGGQYAFGYRTPEGW